MTVFSFRTLAAPSESMLKEQGSRFMAFAYPVASEEEVKEYLGKLKKQYFDATHHCYAYLLGPDKGKFRAFDDGEPNHSAGDPILGQIRASNITDALIVVVRYFGGTKLGVGGLMQAYKIAAGKALENAIIIEKEIVDVFLFTFDYSATPEVMKLIKDFDIKIAEQFYNENSTLKTEVPCRGREKLLEKLTLLRQLNEKIEWDIL